jgi:hypothetical protein
MPFDGNAAQKPKLCKDRTFHLAMPILSDYRSSQIENIWMYLSGLEYLVPDGQS